MLKVGFSEFDITPPVGKLIPGGFTPCLTSEPARGKLLVTAAAFEVDGNPLILVSADTLSIQISTCDRIRRRISEATGVPFDRILVGATHTHTGGQTDYQLWLCPPDLEVASLTEEGIVSAVREAYGKLSGAAIGTAKGEEIRYSFCRDIRMTDGSITMNPNRAHRELMIAPIVTPDYSVNVMRIDSAEGEVRGFIVNYAAYFAEIYRGGIDSMPVGQYEAAEVLGYTKTQAFLRIILPQVIKRIMPSVTNEVITLVKDTSLAFTLAYQEVFSLAKQISASQTSFTPFIIAGVFYFIANYAVAFGMQRIEKLLDYYK